MKSDKIWIFQAQMVNFCHQILKHLEKWQFWFCTNVVRSACCFNSFSILNMCTNVVVFTKFEDTHRVDLWENRSQADNVWSQTWPRPRNPLSASLSRNHVTNAPRKIFLGGRCDTEEPPLWHRGAAMYSRFISAVSAARQPSLIREMTQVINIFNFYHFHFSHTPQTILSVRFLRLLRQRWSLCLEDSQTPRCSLSSSSPLKSREEIKSSFRERVCRWTIFP